MKPSKQAFDRLKKILVTDKMGVGEGFMQVFKAELTRLAKDYFQVDGEMDLSVELDDYGMYRVSVSFVATETKGFSVACDGKKGIY